MLRWPLLVVLYALCGFVWALFHAWQFHQSSQPLQSVLNQDVVVEGKVVSLPQKDARRTRFMFQVNSLAQHDNTQVVNMRILLSWYTYAPTIKAGQRWRLLVRLRHAHGFVNPGGFDYEQWLFRQGVHATGYVRATPRQVQQYSAARDVNAQSDLNRRISTAPDWFDIDGIRQQMFDHLSATLQADTQRGLVLALALGERQAITSDQWAVLRMTGTSHLMAISGLHIGLVAGISFYLFAHAWRWLGALPRPRVAAVLLLRYPAAYTAAIVAMTTSACYATLAGFSIPTQRALIMVCVVMLAMISGAKLRQSSVLALALFLVLLVDPFSAMDTGFWLSFVAVSVILLSMSDRLGQKGVWWKWGRVQLVVLIGLFPVMLLVFQQVPVLSPVANIFAVPWVGIITVPLTLLGSLLAGTFPGDVLLQLAADSINLIWFLLDNMAHIPGVQWRQHAPVSWTLLPATAGILFLLIPTGIAAKSAALILLLPLLMIKPRSPGPGEVFFTLLDVGQGLAAIVQTQHHTLVYDTGPAYSDSFNSGESIVVPYLRHRGIGRVDMLVVSHADSDHAGGLTGVLDNITVGRVLSGEPAVLKSASIPVFPCDERDRWQWDGVRFDVLYPPADVGRSYQGNNASCVLKISSIAGTVLLTGDIEKPAEYYLYRQKSREKDHSLPSVVLQADILVAPHHGSKTSSTNGFIQATAPKYVLIPVGYANRFGLPDKAVRHRYQQAGAIVLETASAGAIEVRLTGQSLAPSVVQHRYSNRRFYHHWVEQ